MKLDAKKPIPKRLRGELAVCSQNPEKILFLDIETTGLSIYYDEITIVGWSFGGAAKTLISSENSDTLFKDAREANALVTFNGIRFDKKFLEKEFPAIVLPPIHIDLMYLCRRVGLTGGQKKIENLLGLDYRGDIPEVDGFAAVLLWHSYLRGEVDALRRLIQYNRADIAAMGAIFDEALTRLGYEPDLLGEEVSFKRWAAVPDRKTKSRVRSPSGLSRRAIRLRVLRRSLRHWPSKRN